MSAITAKASRKMKKYAVLTREPRCFLGSFDFSWEQRKLTEFVEFFSGLTYTPNDVQENGTLVLRSSNVSNGEVVDADNIYVNPQVVNSENVKVGDIVVVVRNGSRSLIGKHAQIKAFMPNTVIGAFMTGIRSECPEFTNALLNTSRFEEEIAMNMGATINQITGYMFSKMEFKVPCLDEQKKIGEYFEKLDNLITLHQRKCANLCSPSQVVFSLLFATSTFSWEQRKLGELVDVCSGRDYKHLSEGTIPVYGTGGYMLSVNDALSYDRDAIGIGRKGTIDRPYILKAPFWTVDTLFYAIPREKVDLNYAFDIFQNIDWKKKDESTGVPSLSKTAINDIDVLAPKHDEQQIIGQFFAAIDNLITLHQRECISFTGRADRLILTANKKRTTSSWEQRKLGELGTITTGSTPSTSIPDYYSDDGIVWVTPTDICENITFESARKLSDLGQQVGRVVPKNTILVTCIASIGKNTMLGNTGSFNQQINGLTPNEKECDPYFLLTESALWSAKMKSSAAAGTMQIVNRTEFSELKTWLPNLIEQQAISDFFRQLDNLITLHQRKPFLMKWRTSDANRNQTNRLVL